MTTQTFLQCFETGQIAASEFGHREHVRAAFEMLRKYSFLEATSIYSRCLESLARTAGVPEKFNLTMTMAFMSLIAEKMAACPESEFKQFYAANPGLSQNPLKYWYSPQRLNSPLARKVFLMPGMHA